MPASSGTPSAPEAKPRELPPPLTRMRGKGSRKGAVVAVEPRAAEVGARILERGGNAVDAAIATTFALCVTHPSAASLGGGGFALVRSKAAPDTVAFDFREVAPRALTRPNFDRMIAAHARGQAAVGVPGTVAGLALLHERFGSLPLAELIRPAIALARDGHTLRAWQAKVLGWSYPALKLDPSARSVFGKSGKPIAERGLLVQKDLAASLERLAEFGPKDFYTGKLAESLAKGLAPDGPTLEDLAAYRAFVRTPLRFDYRGYTVETMPPPSAGGVALAGILLGLGSRPIAPLGHVDAIHTFLEASRRAQAERRLGVVDPDSLTAQERTHREGRWLDPAFWLKVPLDPAHATPSAAVHPLFGMISRESDQTTHLSVADGQGMVVSLTTTLSASFGAKIVAGSTGIVMNNSVGSFSFSGDNQPAPGKRTTSSMAPTLLLRGSEVAAVLGTPGGDTIPSTIAQIVRNLVDYRLPLDEAILAPRWHHGFVPDTARYEPKPSPGDLLDALRKLGHSMEPFRRGVGDANCIALDGDMAYGFADPREFGATAIPKQD